jgi:ribose 1,5-bisphosphokinase
MSFVATLLRSLAAVTRPIGPGRLVLVVGPSGAGKDTLIARAAGTCRGDRSVVFPRRVVTRPPSPFEDNEFVSLTAFQDAAEQGAFALWWGAHGHMYGIGRGIDAELAAGRTVVCNASRAVVAAARERYANVVVVLVTAPPAVLAARLAARGRASDADAAERLARADAVVVSPDVVIDNVGSPEAGARRLLDAIRAGPLFVG